MIHSIRAVAERPTARRWLAATAGLALSMAAILPAKAQDTIKVGILHSLSGTMAISETTLKDTMLMLIAVAVVIFQLLTDLVYAYLDPRIHVAE